MRSVNGFMVIGVLVASASVFGGCMSSEESPGTQRTSLSREVAVAELDALPPAGFSAATAVVEAPWGDAEGAFQRETVAAQTGPMAIAAERDEGFSIVDTVGARVYRYTAEGELRGVIATSVETADDLTVLPGGGVALLAYRRTPTPGYDLMTFDDRGSLLERRAAPQGASLPTAVVADGDQVYVEQRHEQLLPDSGGEALWGRPDGDLLVRARLDDGDAVLWTADREGQTAWSLRVDAPWPVTELLAVESAEPYLAIVLRHIETGADGDPVGQETWLVTVSHAGEALGSLRLVDSRVTDAGRPFALTPGGAVLELVTSEEGVSVLRYDVEGDAS